MKRLTALALFLLIFTGCGNLWTGPSPEGEEEAAPAAEESAAAATDEAPAEAPKPASRASKAALESGTSTLEVFWQIPGEAVEKYHLYYGLEADELTNHIEVMVNELQKVDDPKHGPVYRYELKDIPAKRAIYLSLRAENKYGMSDASPATRVEPGQRTVTPN